MTAGAVVLAGAVALLLFELGREIGRHQQRDATERRRKSEWSEWGKLCRELSERIEDERAIRSILLDEIRELESRRGSREPGDFEPWMTPENTSDPDAWRNS